MHDNVTTGILKLENYEDNPNNDNEETLNQFKKLLETSNTNTALMNAQYLELVKNNMTDYNVNLSVVDNLNNKITTYGQAINMNNYETAINNKILVVLGFGLLIIVIIFVFVMVYFNNKTGGKIKLFGFEGKPSQ
jgi:ATP-dependent Zn protease